MFKTAFSFILKNPYVVLGVVLATLAVLVAIYAKGYSDGKAHVESKNVSVAVDIKEKQDEVRSRRPDVPAIADSLHEHRL